MPPEFLFGEQPIVNIMAIAPPARLVKVVGKPRDLISSWTIAAAKAFGQRLFAGDERKDL
jgi:hypothetical protein